MATIEGGVARKLWIKFRNESIYVLYSPFIICLVSGVLDLRSFTHFLSQDQFFFRAFAKAYELAEECADDDDDKASIRNLRTLVMKKLNDHSEVVRDWGFELPSESTSVGATTKYTDFLLATASGKVGGEKLPGKIATPFEKTKLAAYTLAAVAPYMRFSASISKEILAFQSLSHNDHTYKKWIASLSSQNYEGATLEIEELLEKLSVSLTGEELQVVENIYHQALKHQIQFFYAQPMFQKAVTLSPQRHDIGERRLSIFCDFDTTCSAIDSSAILAEIAIRTARKAAVDVTSNQLVRMSSTDVKNTWGFISSKYTEEYEQCIDSITSGDKVEELDYEGLCNALGKVAEFEKKANTRVIESGVLKGLNREDFRRAGDHLLLQGGCKGFFQEIAKHKNLKADAHCISYCWCGDMIRSAFSSGGMDIEDVYCNELAYEDNVSTGDMIRKVESPMEKFEAFNEKVGKEGGHITICIGGSVGDTLCLLNADIGIAIDPSHSLTRLGDKFGISFVPLFTGLVRKQMELTEGSSSVWKGRSGVVYTVSSWAEIHAFIFGV